MNQNWFECKIKYDKNVQSGQEGEAAPQKVSETYLVDAMSFTEAESRIIEEIRDFISGEFEVTNIRKIRVSDLFPCPNGDKWYKGKLMYITIDEEKGVEKRTANTVMVQASDIADALKGITDGMGTTAIDYEIASITETAIMDVYPYNLDKNDQPMSAEEKLAREAAQTQAKEA